MIDILNKYLITTALFIALVNYLLGRYLRIVIYNVLLGSLFVLDSAFRKGCQSASLSFHKRQLCSIRSTLKISDNHNLQIAKDMLQQFTKLKKKLLLPLRV